MAGDRRAVGAPGRRETADFLIRDLGTPEGGFASALDADTDGVEGLTYVWTPDQLIEVLGPDDGGGAAAVSRSPTHGTFEHGASTLQLPYDPDDARAVGRRHAARLLAARASGRSRPATTRW